jgi:hypothetical protein
LKAAIEGAETEQAFEKLKKTVKKMRLRDSAKNISEIKQDLAVLQKGDEHSQRLGPSKINKIASEQAQIYKKVRNDVVQD